MDTAGILYIVDFNHGWHLLRSVDRSFFFCSSPLRGFLLLLAVQGEHFMTLPRQNIYKVLVRTAVVVADSSTTPVVLL